MARRYVEAALYVSEGPEDEDLSDYVSDQTVLIRKKHLRFLPDHNYPNEVDPPYLVEWYPLCNSYYPYTEDVDAFGRVNHLLADGGPTEFETLTVEDCVHKVKIPYSEQDAQLAFLRTKPTSYLVLGKPDIGEAGLGRILAEEWGCVYVDPQVLLDEEIRSGSRAGCCIEFNLRCGRAVAVDVVLRLLEKRLRTESVLHRGCVVCGFPLVQNDLYEEDPVSSESAIFTAQEIFEEIFDTVTPSGGVTVSVSKTSKARDDESDDVVVDEGVEPISPRAPKVIPADLGSMNESICFQPTIMGDYEKQLQFVFDLFENPYVIIYVACPNSDVVSKRALYRYDVMNQEIIDLQAHEMNKFVFTLYSKETRHTNDLHYDKYDDLQGVDRKLLLHLPKDFPVNVNSQLDRYHYAILKVIDKKVLLHKQGYFIKTDGRLSPSKMFHMIKSRLRITEPKAVLPVGMADEPDEQLGESPREPIVNETLTLDECFEKIRKKEITGPLFKWTWSNWGKLCPVAMKEGTNLEGLPQYPVRFMNRIFFLSSEEAYVKFCRNPRPYLMPPYPRVVCKVFVMGPPHSGKTAVSKCLGYLFQSPVLSPMSLQKEYCQHRMKELRGTIQSNALNKAIIILNKQREDTWRREEEQRLLSVEDWKLKIRELLDVLVHYKSRSSLQEVSAFPLKLGYSELEDNASELNFNRTIEELHELNITCTDDQEKCKKLLSDDGLLLRHLPKVLRRRTEREPATVFDDFVQKYVMEALKEAAPESMVLDSETVQTIFRDRIREVQMENCGWIIDDYKPNLEFIESLDSDILPDEVVVLEDEPPYDLLIERSKKGGLSQFHDYKELFEKLDVPDIILDAIPTASTTSFKEQLASGIVHDVVDTLPEPEDSWSQFENENNQIENITEYYKNVNEVCDILEAKGTKITRLKINNKSVEQVLMNAVNEMRDKFRIQAKPFTPEDRLEEVENLGEARSEAGEGAELGDLTNENEDNFSKSRRYGDTSFYCPVAFHDYFVLWKGKEELAVKLENRLYLCSNESNMKKFLNKPYDYLTTNEPASAIPPLRICVNGPKMAGKTSMAAALADNFGLYYVDLRHEVEKYASEGDLTDEQLEESRDFLNRRKPLSETLQEICIGPLWFQEPIRSFGFVIDGYPENISDVEIMLKNYWIPTVIIQINASLETISLRFAAKYLAEWSAEMDKKQRMQDISKRQILNEWEAKRAKYFNVMMEEKRAKRYRDKLQKMTEEEEFRTGTDLSDLKEVENETDRSQVSLASIDEQADMDEINAFLNVEMPEPTFDKLETYEEAKTRLESDLDRNYEVEVENQRVLRELCDSELIPIKIVDGNLLLKQMVAAAFRIAGPLKPNSSHLERCYEISIEMAEKLLATGYYFSSRFNRTCPVQYFENKSPVQLFLPYEQKFKVFPVIHRQYIYFIAGKKNLDKFKDHPLKYVYQPCVNFPLIPYRISIIGPPKCGKTTLSERFQFEYGFKIISRGSAVRYVLSHLRHSKLAKDIEEVLREGWELTDEMTMRSVEAAAYDARAVAQGIVFDGFPNTIGEVRHLADLGLVPHVVVELQASLETVLECLRSEVVLKGGVPRYSERFIEYRFREREKGAEGFRSWFEREYQLLATVETVPSKWSVWDAAHKIGLFSFYEVQFYYRRCLEDWPVRLHCMQVTPVEFLERRSSYRHYCPACLYQENQLVNGGDPPDRSGLVQFRKRYYWICQEHLDQFLSCPEQYLPPYNPKRLPSELPERLKLFKIPANLHSDGFCVICYKESLPELVFREGDLKYAVSYKDSVYLFCSYGCLREFTKYPKMYAGVSIRKKRSDDGPSLGYSDLPVLGLLEQYVADSITKAVSKAAFQRPIIPGLGPEASAAIFIGLQLKCQKAECEDIETYRSAMEMMTERCRNTKRFLKEMKEVINPFVYYDEPMPSFKIPSPKTEAEVAKEKGKASKSAAFGIIDELLRRVVE